MFGNSDDNKRKKKAPVTPNGALNSIVNGTEVHGDIECESDIRIDGTLIGSLNCSGRFILGETGSLQGEVTCDDAVVQGQFEGDLYVKQVLDVKKTAQINGQITTEKLVVESGAVFNVHCRMGGKSFGKVDGNESGDKSSRQSTKGKKETA